MIIDRKTQFYIDTFGKCPLLHPYVVLLNKGNNNLPNTEQFSKVKGKTHKSTNRQNQSTTGKLGKPQWP